MLFLRNQSTNMFILSKRMCLWCPIMKSKEITMWIHVYPNWTMNINSKNGNKRSFSYETKTSISFILIRRMCLCCPIMKRNEITMWIQVYPNWKKFFNSKNGNKRSFCYETKPSTSFMPMRRMCLWCLIMNRMEIIIWIHVCSNR